MGSGDDAVLVAGGIDAQDDGYDAIADLGAAVREAGATVTFDGRRYARAAAEWPDCLPPMFGQAAVEVERWGMTRWRLWVARRPEQWPAAPVRAGELWEQKSALVPTWELAESLSPLSIYANVRHRVVRVDGEAFLNDRGIHCTFIDLNGTPIIPGPNWRRLEAAP